MPLTQYSRRRTAMSGKPKKNSYGYTLGEEIANAVTHGLGTLLAAAGTVVMIVFAALKGDPWRIVSASIYGFSLIVLFTMSTIYHALAPNRAKYVFRIFDHTTIYLLIAGSYTPITLVLLHGAFGWVLFGIVWGVCILGIVLNSISVERFKKISMIFYIIAGWAIVLAIVPMIKAMAPVGLWFMLIGGLCYTGGIIFYKLKSVKFMHSIWHLFVLAGAVLHYFAILFYIIMA